jgi:hypothetical protein
VKFVGRGIIAGDETDAARFEHVADDGRTQKPVELGDNKNGLRPPCMRNRTAKLWAVVEIMLLARLNFDVLSE